MVEFKVGSAYRRFVRSESAAVPGDGPVSRVWQQLALIFCLLVVIQDGHYGWISSGRSVTGTTGMALGRTECDPLHYCPVLAIKQASPADRAGVRVGDRARLDARCAPVAFYRRNREAYYLSRASLAGFPKQVDVDDPAVVALRAERALQREGPANAALLLPMLYRAEVIGFLAIGKRTDGAPYRPDEEVQLSAAAHQIGLDLHALRVEELEVENAQLAARVTVLVAPV